MIIMNVTWNIIMLLLSALLSRSQACRSNIHYDDMLGFRNQPNEESPALRSSNFFTEDVEVDVKFNPWLNYMNSQKNEEKQSKKKTPKRHLHKNESKTGYTGYVPPEANVNSDNVPLECFERKESGNCLAAVTRYYYSPDDKKCYEFIYTGCQGNNNNFETQEACEKKCIHLLPDYFEGFCDIDSHLPADVNDPSYEYFNP